MRSYRSGQILGDMIALGLILTIFCPYEGHSQEIHMEEKLPPMEVWLGQNLTIPCVLAKAANQDLDLNVSTVDVRWSKMLPNGSETNVYKFRNYTHEDIRPGSTIDERELKRGNASLTLPHVQGNDEGEYICTIYITPNKAWTKVNVTVLGKPNISLSTPELTIEPGGKDSVICEVSRFYPKGVKIQWAKHSRRSGTCSFLEKPSYRTELEENSDGSYNVSSQLVVAPSCPEENGDVYHCVVTHESFSPDQNVSVTLIVEELSRSCFTSITINSVVFGLLVLIVLVAGHLLTVTPKVSEIIGVDDLVHMKRSTLVFMVSGFKPNDIEVHLYLKRAEGIENHKIESWKHPPPQRGKKCTVKYSQRGECLTLSSSNEIHSFLEKEKQPLKLKRSFMVYSCLCSTHITPDKERDDEAELVIQVIHTSLKSPLIVRQTIKINKADPSQA